MNKKKTVALFAGLFFIGSAWVHPPLLTAQEYALPVDKILNPLPEFDPFERVEPAPQFFPDAVDKRIRETLIDALTNSRDALNEDLKYFKSEDARLQKQYGTVTGLSEHAQDLVNNTLQDRDRYLAAQKEATKEASSPTRKKYLESIINNDDLNLADQLMRQSTTNSWGGVFNRMLGSVDLVGIASGNYIGAAAETLINGIYALTERDMSIQERRALARELDHLKRYPDDPRNAEIQKRVESLDKQKIAALVRKQLDKAKEASKKGDFDKALFFAEMASFLEPESPEAQKALKEATQLSQDQEQGRQKSLTVGRETDRPAEQNEDVKRLLQALSLRDAHQTERLAVDIEKKYHGQPLGDAALDAEAVALEMKGWHEESKKAVQQVARSAVAPEAKKRATELLESPEYNLLATFRDAQTDRQVQTVKYVLLGEDLLKKNILYAAGAMAAAGPSGAAALGTVNAILMTNNLVQVLTNNPISAQPVIDAGVAYVRSHPNSDNAAEVYKVLADAYEERGALDKAISYHELAGTPKQKIAQLKEKAANALLASAGKSSDRDARQYYLTSIIDEYPESPAAAEATKKLADLAKDENQGLRMSKQFLQEHPEIYGPGGLNLKASLFDGNLQNMELADRGVNLISDHELIVYYQTPWGVRSQSHRLPAQTTDRFFTALRQANHEVAMADVNQRAKGSVGGIQNMPRPILTAERETKKAKDNESDDTTFSLLREAGGPVPSFSKVLDYDLLSENERNPGSKYKLPLIQGSIGARSFSMNGALPAGLWGNQIAVGTDSKGAFAGVKLPVPLLQGFIPVDFMIQGRPGGFSIYPRIHTAPDKGEDPELYR
ncbi:MAG TPA: hypothetical protein VGA09_07300 [Candidatus Binatia bacterium]